MQSAEPTGLEVRKRSTRKPKPVNPMAHIMAMQGATLLDRSDVIRFSLAVSDSVDAISKGNGVLWHWQQIFSAINVMEELVRMGCAKDEGGMLDAMQESVVGVLDRQRETGVKALRSTELMTLRDVVATFTELLSGITHAELFQAHERSAARIKRVLSTGSPDVRVIRPPGDLKSE